MAAAMVIGSAAVLPEELGAGGVVPAGGLHAFGSPNLSSAAKCRPVGPVPTVSPGGYDELNGIAVAGSDDVWTVGRYVQKNGRDRDLIEQWTGSAFQQVPSPNPQPNDVLLGVTAVSPTDIWAVGETWSAKYEVFFPLAEHWDGQAWSVVSTADLASGSGSFSNVAAVSADDVWAVGTQFSGPGYGARSTLVEHWDGTSWQVVASPNPGNGSYLSSVTTISTDDVWAVGSSYVKSKSTVTLTEHWDGSQWSVVQSPDVDIEDSLESVSAVDATDVWAVGDYFEDTSGGSLTFTLTEHFDGTRWSVVASPSPTDDNNLLAVTAVGSDDVWAVGGAAATQAALVEHWDGTQWNVAQEPYRHGSDNFLYAVDAGPAPGVWAAGTLLNQQTLATHYCKA